MSHAGAGSDKAKPISVSHPAARAEELVESSFAEDLIVAAGHGHLTEDLALAILRRRDLSVRVLEALIRNHSVIKHRKVLVQVIQHPRTPRHISLPLLRRLFVFELMHVSLEPAVAADLKLLADGVLIDKLETVSLGECINLARRASPAVTAALLLHKERAVIEAALQNPRLTEASIAKSLAKPEVSPLLLSMLAEHPKWSTRRELQVAIVRRPEANDILVLQTAAKLPKSTLLEVIEHLNLSKSRTELLRTLLAER